MPDIATLAILTRTDELGKASASLRQLRQEAGLTEQATGRLGNSSTALNSRMGGLASTLGSLRVAFAGLIGGAAVTQLASYVDTFQRVENQLKLVTDSVDELTSAQSANFQIAQQTFSSYEATGNVFARFARSVSELREDQGRLASVVTTTNQAVALSGTTSAGAAAALFQFGQGLASDTLRGEELNSVMEQTPRLAQALADGLGVPIGQLRVLAAEGELTSRRIIAALESQTDVLQAEFAQLEPTIGQVFGNLGNSVMQFVATVDEASGTSGLLKDSILAISAALDTLSGITISDSFPSWLRETLDLALQLSSPGGALQAVLDLVDKYIPAAQGFREATGELLAGAVGLGPPERTLPFGPGQTQVPAGVIPPLDIPVPSLRPEIDETRSDILRVNEANAAYTQGAEQAAEATKRQAEETRRLSEALQERTLYARQIKGNEPFGPPTAPGFFDRVQGTPSVTPISAEQRPAAVDTIKDAFGNVITVTGDAKTGIDGIAESLEFMQQVGTSATASISAGLTNMAFNGGTVNELLRNLGQTLFSIGTNAALNAFVGLGGTPGQQTGVNPGTGLPQLVASIAGAGRPAQFGAEFVVPGGGIDDKTMVARVSGGERVRITQAGQGGRADGGVKIAIETIDMRGADGTAVAKINQLKQELQVMVQETMSNMVDASPAVAGHFRAG